MSQRSNAFRRLVGFGATFALLATTLVGCGRAGLPLVANASPRDLGPVTAASFKGDKPVVVGVTFQSKKQLAKLVDAGFECWYVDEEAKKAYGQIGRAEFQAGTRGGFEFRQVAGPGAFNQFDKGYRTYDQIKAELIDLAAKYPEMAKFVDLGDGWEKTAGKGDRDVMAIHIGKGDVSKKPAVLLCGEHHAREIVTPEIVMNIAHMLLEGYGTDADMTHFIENRDIWLVPMVNPDGHRLASEGKDWRKNTNITTGGGSEFGSGPTGPGVDLNRNYGFKWGGPGASTSPSSATFRGPGAFSEPETQAIKNLVESRKFTFLMTYHSFSNLILWPWGHTDAPPPDKRLPAIGQKLGRLSGYKPQQSVNLYPTSGDTTDWAFGQHNILAYTTEIGGWSDGFDPPYAKVAEFWKQNMPGAKLMLTLADKPAHVFGPELRTASSKLGAVQIVAPKDAVEVEVFTGTVGDDGTGVKATVDPDGNATVTPAVGKKGRGMNLALVHARNAAGEWGPIKAVFVR